MTGLHIAVGISVIGTNLLAAAWGGWAWHNSRDAPRFWYALRAAQIAVVAQAALGAVLVMDGREAPDGLHYVYGILPLMISLMAEGARGTAAHRELEGLDFEALPPERQRSVGRAIVRREVGIMALACGVVVGLALRAAFTTPGI